VGEVGFPSARSRLADAGDRRHGDGDQPDSGDAAAVRYASCYSPEFVAAVADALHLAKHRAVADTFGFDPGCLAIDCYPDAGSDSGNATSSAAFSRTLAESVPSSGAVPGAPSQSATLATSSRLPPRSAVSSASDMSVSAVRVR